MFRKLLTLEQLRREHIASKIGRFLIFCIGCGLGYTAYQKGLPFYISLIVIADFAMMAL